LIPSPASPTHQVVSSRKDIISRPPVDGICLHVQHWKAIVARPSLDHVVPAGCRVRAERAVQRVSSEQVIAGAPVERIIAADEDVVPRLAEEQVAIQDVVPLATGEDVVASEDRVARRGSHEEVPGEDVIAVPAREDIVPRPSAEYVVAAQPVDHVVSA